MQGSLADYDPGGDYDEVFERRGVPRAAARDLATAFDELAWPEIAERQRRADIALANAGITFTVYGETQGTERIFPFDVFPRPIPESEWDTVVRGLGQRVVALNAFLQDIYTDARIVQDGRIPPERVFGSPNYRPEARGHTPPGGVWNHVSGIDLVRDKDGVIYVLEDNIRTPSGVSYVLENRLISNRALPRVRGLVPVRPLEDYANILGNALRSLAPAPGTAAVLTPGAANSAYFEHSYLAKQMGVQLVEGRDLEVDAGRLHMRTTAGLEPVGALYRRTDDEFLDPLVFRPDSMLGVPGVLGVYRAGTLCLANAIGTGVADDKAVYPYVPAFIRYYLGEEPILPNVPTFHADIPKEAEHILAHLPELVVKPTNASGGYGVVIGPTSDEKTLHDTAQAIKERPAEFIAQPLIHISTCPTVVDGEFVPRRVDLRPFAIYDGAQVRVLSGGLTRVALREGSFVVNSSQGGGSKDTWILEEPHAAA